MYSKNCVQCNSLTFRQKKSEAIRKNWLFCSRRCKALYVNSSRVKKEERKCKFCKLIFLVILTNKRKAKLKFCSRTCSLKYRNYFDNPTEKLHIRQILSKKSKERGKAGIAQLHTASAIEKRRQTISGKGHWNWQGGISSENNRARQKLEYRLWRQKIFERDNWTCQLCEQRGGNLQADHIKPFAYFPELRHELSNGRTLCIDCHKKTDTYMGRAKRHFVIYCKL